MKMKDLINILVGRDEPDEQNLSTIDIVMYAFVMPMILIVLAIIFGNI